MRTRNLFLTWSRNSNNGPSEYSMGLQESNVIEFGGRRDNDREYGIIQGKITLTASEVRTTFDGVIKQSADSCLKLLHGRKVKHLILVGGFGESPYLRLRFEEEFASQGTDVITDEEPSKKAAAEGAVMWYIKQMVTAHVARFTIGASILVLFNPANAEHWKRRNGVIIYPDGETYLQDGFRVFVEKGQLIPQNFSESYCYVHSYSKRPESLDHFQMGLMAWEGEGTSKWIADADGKILPQIRTLCFIKADLSPTIAGLKQLRGKNGVKYWQGTYDVRCIYGGTKLQARLEWNVEGKAFQGPIKVVPTSVWE